MSVFRYYEWRDIYDDDAPNGGGGVRVGYSMNTRNDL
jgi:hypothetical protein